MKVVFKNSTLSFRSKKELVGDLHTDKRIGGSGLVDATGVYNAVLYSIEDFAKIQVKTICTQGSAAMYVLVFLNDETVISSETIMSDGMITVQDVTGQSGTSRATISSRDINVPAGAKRIGINYSTHASSNPDGWVPQVFGIKSAE
jgi:hypothetical protein